MIKKFGFTLAEVLITLGIIGVVAAMTIPTLMQKTNDSEIKSSYKKMISVLNQAIAMNYALDGVDFTNISGTGSHDDTQGGTWMGFLYNRLNVVSSDGSSTVYFSDGTSIQLTDVNKTCTEASPCAFIIDVNGKKTPNTETTSTDALKDRYTLKAFRRQVSPATDDTIGQWILTES